ncbi:MAG: hypothetical protein SGARI_002492 [Bacillariaceae sp.]
MGRVPMDSSSGAMECVQAIMAAAMRTEGENGVFFVDLHLPSYDISQGERQYDEVLATEFCIELSNGLEGKSEILVRDQKTLDTVEKILHAREEAVLENVEEDDFDDDEEEEEEGEEDSEPHNSDAQEISLEEDVDSFRQKLMAGWDEGDAAAANEIDESSSPTPTPPPPTPTSNRPRSNKTYRLASMFGSARIGSDGDMPQDVVRAVRDNALALENERNIIILSPAGQDEMVVSCRLLQEKKELGKIWSCARTMELPQKLWFCGGILKTGRFLWMQATVLS